MNAISYECSLKWTWSQMKWSQMKWPQMKWSQINVVSNECGLKWLWSQINVVSNDCGLKWTWSQMKKSLVNVVSNELGLKWLWSQMKWSRMNRCQMMQVLYECGLKNRGLKRMVSNERGLKWTWSQMNVVSNDLVSIVMEPGKLLLEWGRKSHEKYVAFVSPCFPASFSGSTGKSKYLNPNKSLPRRCGNGDHFVCFARLCAPGQISFIWIVIAIYRAVAQCLLQR